MFQRLGAQLFLIATTMALAIAANSALRSDDKPADKSAGALLTRDEARKLKSPVSFSKASIARGKVLYKRACTECHGADGKSQVDVIANATDLTNPKAFHSGVSAGEIYRSIRDGAGESMPPFVEKVTKEQDLWDMVNYLESLWPEAARPKLTESTAH
jgi:mono/diheme cytochrome c family protein